MENFLWKPRVVSGAFQMPWSYPDVEAGTYQDMETPMCFVLANLDIALAI